MSTYIKPGKALEFDNAPDWLVAYMRYRRTLLGNTPTSIMTDFISLREYFQWLVVYQATGKSPETKMQLRQTDLLDMPLKSAIDAKRNDIETYLYFCADFLSNSEVTRAKKLISIRCFYNYVIDQEDTLQTGLQYNPAERIKNAKAPKKQPIYLPEKERTSLLNAVKGENAIRDYAILLLITTCGLRVSEVVNLSMRDFNFSAKKIRIHGKGNKERTAYPTPACIEALLDYKNLYRDACHVSSEPNDPFFISKTKGTRLTTRTIERIMQKYVNAAGIGGMGYTPHKLRHTTATILAKDGVDLLTIQQLMGHESPTTTQIYTHLGSEDLARAVKHSSLMNIGD